MPTVAAHLRAEHAYIWSYCGTHDRLRAGDQAFAEELTRDHVPHHFFTASGGHSWGIWRAQMAGALITASEHLRHV